MGWAPPIRRSGLALPAESPAAKWVRNKGNESALVESDGKCDLKEEGGEEQMGFLCILIIYSQSKLNVGQEPYSVLP